MSWTALPAPQQSRALGPVHPAAARLAAASRAPNTIRGYRADMAGWTAWAQRNGRDVLPANPRDLEEYLVEEAETHTPGTLARRIAALKLAHELAGYVPAPTQDPHLRKVLEGIRREYGRPAQKRDALLLDELHAAIAACPADISGARDRAVLALGWFSACRRSELAAFHVEHIGFGEGGLTVLIPRSKTDQYGEGRTIAIPHWEGAPGELVCGVCRLTEWLSIAGISSGPVFRRINGWSVLPEGIEGRTVALIVQRAMRRAGIPGRWGGHSLRAGHVTEAILRGVDPLIVAAQTGHKRLDTMRGYIRMGELFTRNSVSEMAR